MVSGVTKDRHCTSGHVDYVGLAERVPSIAQEKNISLGDNRRRRRGRRSGGCRCVCGFGDPFHWWWRGHSQFVLIVGSIWAVNMLQVPHLLVDHPQFVSLIKLKKEKEATSTSATSFKTVSPYSTHLIFSFNCSKVEVLYPSRILSPHSSADMSLNMGGFLLDCRKCKNGEDVEL